VSQTQELDTGYRKIWDFGNSWDPDAYAAQPRSLGEIRRDLVMQRNWKGFLDRMKTNMTVGCLQVRGPAHPCSGRVQLQLASMALAAQGLGYYHPHQHHCAYKLAQKPGKHDNRSDQPVLPAA
jgi:hypothetical protein